MSYGKPERGSQHDGRRGRSDYYDTDRQASSDRASFNNQQSADDFRIRGAASNRQRSRSPERRPSYDESREYQRNDRRDYDYQRPRNNEYVGGRRTSDHGRSRGGQYRQRDERFDRGKHGSNVDYYNTNKRYGNQNRSNERYPMDTSWDYEEFSTTHHQNMIVEAQRLSEHDLTKTDEPSRFLIIRQLKPTVTIEILARGLEKLYHSDGAIGGANRGSIRSVLLIHDRVTQDSACFGFAEYHTSYDAEAAMHHAYKLGDDCTISSRKITVNRPHNGVFKPVMMSETGLAKKETRTVTRMDSNQRWYYRDERFYASQLMVNEEYTRPTSSSSNQSSIRSQPMRPAPSTDSGLEKKKKPVSKSSASNPPLPMLQQFQKWTTQSAAIHGEAAQVPLSDVEISAPAQLSDVSTITAPAQTESIQTYCVVTSNGGCWCLLCMRDLGSVKALDFHILQSEMHSANMEKEEATKAAVPRLAAQGFSLETTHPHPGVSPTVSQPPPVVQQQEASTQYVDRAAVRRREEAAAGPMPKISLSLKRNNDQAMPEPRNNALDKGLAMLKKQGWTAGQGLGAEGREGVAAPISTEVYAPGVGLGFAGGKQGDAVEMAEANTRGGYAEQVKEAARKRLQNLQ